MARTIALVLPLSLDTFAIAAALGMTGLTGAQRIRVGLLFAAFEGGMPVIGLLVGAGLGQVIGGWSEYIAIAALAGLGAYMLFGPEDNDKARVQGLLRTGGLAVVGLGLSISLDELAIGFSAGLLRLEIVPLVLAVGAQAFLVTQLGLRIGARVGATIGASAERLAAAALLALAAALLAARLSS